ncbi:MAG: hypothetical protein A2087_11495 [Spirochaetes bacterium GWD1_61_31]|nr:MAG: hypothetical protein A2Y37_14725 [Spirochaetes bacterium GWB1_60_80]OHD29317.1 MAG: hypothetical protein A2004_08225 [Spirochaetes bacterium GWC1_61_12]OHD35825.1 MAG: hypothetical protein A2087_11495 [Spirochaetes bacterium GWD1_61_31]OHD46766.1 MAG: hypothetical protein A2Y35_10665 [Spirochaetes bacterium GWE1_60_18]OHD61218.1 MAG: hypothetical protein A2Y32_12960 [Spirochaetes bacterium GWF1_60_12]HAP43024.1 uracil-DNA glycosylase [Spirochaetaceae bacterium]
MATIEPAALDAPAAESAPVEAGRLLLYRSLSLLEDCLTDGYHQAGDSPEFEALAPRPLAAEARPGRLTLATTQTAVSAVPLPAGEPATAEPSAAGPPSAAESRRAAAEAAALQPLPANDSLETINQEVSRCLKCRLAGSRSRTVPGQGVARPLVLVLGEAPDDADDASGQVFSGEAGLLLDRMLAAIDLSRQQNCYLTQLVKCHPPLGREPAPDEQRACLWYLRRQLALLRPQAILALGRSPAQWLLGCKDGLQKLRGRIYDRDGLPCVVSHGVGNLLRDPELKRPVWEDLKLLKQILADA